MSTNMVRATLALSVSVIALSMGVQSAAAADETATRSLLDEIVVTATKKLESINDVGMSINALGAEEISNKGIRNVEDLALAIPGFTFTRTQFDEPVYTLRGVGYVESSLAANPAVSVYVDEVPLPFPSMTRGAILDVERVEVLKGPQGTLFGQNSTGGAVNYVAAKPGDVMEAGFDASYGRFDSYQLKGFAGGPLSDKVGARVAVSSTQGGAWQKSQTRLSDELGDIDELVGRLLVEVAPKDNFRFTVNLNGWRDQSETQAPQHKGIFAAVPSNPLDPLLIAQPIVGNDARLADWNAGTDFSRDTSFYQAALRAEWDINDDMRATSITSYQRLDRDALGDADATPGESLHLATGGDVKSFVQELRLENFSEAFYWMAGVNYQKDEVFDLQTVFIDTGTSSTVNLGALGLFHFPFFDNITSNDVETWAVFGAGEFDLSETLSLEVSGRYTNSKNEFVGCTADPGTGELAALFGALQLIGVFTAGANPTTAATPGQCITLLDANFNVGSTSAELEEDNFSWRVNLNWAATDDVLIYGNVSKGFKAGNFPNLSASTSGQFVPVTQESLLAYEVGVKATVPEQNMQFNGAVFYYDYSDKQLRGRVQDPLFGQLEALLNIPDSHVWGVEAQWLWQLTEGLRTNINATYVNTEIDGSFVNFTQFGDTADFGGNEFPFSPNFQANADIDYETPTGWAGVDWFAGGSIAYSSETKGGLSNRPELEIDDYYLIDLRTGIRSEDGRWSIMVWGKNITDEYYVLNAFKAQDNIIAYAGRPATYGVSTSLRF